MFIQDLLRVFIIRIACLSPIKASVLLQPLILWIRDHISDLSSLSDVDAWKVVKCSSISSNLFLYIKYWLTQDLKVSGACNCIIAHLCVMNLSVQLKYLRILGYPVF